MSTSHSKRSNSWLFFALTYGWTWFFWIPATLIGQETSAFPVTLLRYLGGIGPVVAAIILTYITQSKEGRRDYWRRVIDLRRIRAKWYAVIFLAVPLLTAIAALLDFLLGGSGIQLETMVGFVSRPWAILPFAAFILLFGPLPKGSWGQIFTFGVLLSNSMACRQWHGGKSLLLLRHLLFQLLPPCKQVV